MKTRGPVPEINVFRASCRAVPYVPLSSAGLRRAVEKALLPSPRWSSTCCSISKAAGGSKRKKLLLAEGSLYVALVGTVRRTLVGLVCALVVVGYIELRGALRSVVGRLVVAYFSVL